MKTLATATIQNIAAITNSGFELERKSAPRIVVPILAAVARGTATDSDDWKLFCNASKQQLKIGFNTKTKGGVGDRLKEVKKLVNKYAAALQLRDENKLNKSQLEIMLIIDKLVTELPVSLSGFDKDINTAVKVYAATIDLSTKTAWFAALELVSEEQPEEQPEPEPEPEPKEPTTEPAPTMTEQESHYKSVMALIESGTFAAEQLAAIVAAATTAPAAVWDMRDLAKADDAVKKLKNRLESEAKKAA